MYYNLKDKLLCQDCKLDLKFSKEIGFMSYVAVCIACGQEYEINLEIRINKNET